MDEPSARCRFSVEATEIRASIMVVTNDVAAARALGDDVMDRAAALVSRKTGHRT
jgi:hypothetical protein